MEEKELLDTQNGAPTEESAPEEAALSEASVTEEATEPEAKDIKSEEPTDGANADEGKGGKKPMTKKKKILNAIFLGVQIALVVFAIILTIIMIMNPKQGEVSSAGIKLMPVMSDSMDGERTIDGVTYQGFATWALVVAKSPKRDADNNVDASSLKVGDIVTFQGLVEGKQELITHRIIEIVEIEGGLLRFRTQGDKADAPVDSTLKAANDFQAVYLFHIPNLGKALWWIRDGYHFIYVIIIPLGLLLIYNIYLVAQIVIEGKMKKSNAAVAERAKQAALASIDEEEIKRRAIEEYLKSQAAASAGGDAPHDDGGTE